MITVTKKEITITAKELESILKKAFNFADTNRPFIRYQLNRDGDLEAVLIQIETEAMEETLPALQTSVSKF